MLFPFPPSIKFYLFKLLISVVFLYPFFLSYRPIAYFSFLYNTSYYSYGPRLPSGRSFTRSSFTPSSIIGSSLYFFSLLFHFIYSSSYIPSSHPFLPFIYLFIMNTYYKGEIFLFYPIYSLGIHK